MSVECYVFLKYFKYSKNDLFEMTIGYVIEPRASETLTLTDCAIIGAGYDCNEEGRSVDDKGKTIYQLAKELTSELGVTQRAVYKKINEQLSEQLEEHIIQDEKGKKLLNRTAQDIVKNSFVQEPVQYTVTEPIREVIEPVTEPTQEVIERLTEPTQEVIERLTEPTQEVIEPVIELTREVTEPAWQVTELTQEVIERLVTERFNNLQDEKTPLLKQKIEDLEAELKTEREHSRELADKLAETTGKVLELADRTAELAKANQVLLGIEQSKTNPALRIGDSSIEEPHKRRGFLNWLRRR